MNAYEIARTGTPEERARLRFQLEALSQNRDFYINGDRLTYLQFALDYPRLAPELSRPTGLYDDLDQKWDFLKSLTNEINKQYKYNQKCNSSFELSYKRPFQKGSPLKLKKKSLLPFTLIKSGTLTADF
jgi:hypothetical protein